MTAPGPGRAFPISVDTTALIKRATDPAVQSRARQIREELGNPVWSCGRRPPRLHQGIDRTLSPSANYSSMLADWVAGSGGSDRGTES